MADIGKRTHEIERTPATIPVPSKMPAMPTPAPTTTPVQEPVPA